MHSHVRRWFSAVVVGAVSATLVLTIPAQGASPPTASAAAVAPDDGVPLGADAVAIARKFVAAQAGDYGLSKADVDELAVSSVVPTERNGLTNVHLQQRVASVDVSSAMLNVTVTSAGKVQRVASSAVAGASKLANTATPRITDVAAARLAATAVGLRPSASFASNDGARGAARERTLGDGGISQDPITARLVYQETKQGALRLAWELGINQLDGEHWWQVRIDAATGDELGRTDWVDEDSHRVFPLPVEAPSFGARALVANPATGASPFGWNDTNAAPGAEDTRTIGNNANAYTDIDANNVPDVGSSPDGGAGLVFDFALDLTQAPSTYRPAAVSNLYYANNRIHDVLHRFGFTEAAGNFQVNNYGNGGLGNDPVNAEAQDGSGTNNANFSTPPDGLSPRMQMFVWDIANPDRDSDLDNGVIIHEYGHGVSNRLTGGPANTGCLNNQEQGGEGWSDYLAYMLTMPTGVEPASGRGIGTYVLNEPVTGPGIRTQKYSTDMAINNHTYDSIKTMVAPHGVGEVWATMLWDLTYALIAEHGFDANLDTGTAGNAMSLQLVMDGMKIQPCLPGFVDARDAILDADVADFGGANQCLIWDAFARRGLGFSADQGVSASKDDGTEAFDLPPACNGVALTTTATPSPIPGGQHLTYDLALENTSPGPVAGVSVASALGDHVAFAPGTATCGGTYNAGTDTVTFPIGAMALGETRACEFQVRVDESPFSTTTFEDDFEPDLSGWVATHGAGAFDWELTTTDPHSPTHAAFSSDPNTVSDQYLTSAAPVPVVANDSLSFWHKRGLESNFDGGVVEISTDGGATFADIGEAAFTENPYNATISGSFGSPIGGRRAFSGTSEYVRSVASLDAYVGQNILVRFRTATDNSVAAVGWTVDDVEIGREVTTTNVLTTSATGFPDSVQEVVTEILEPFLVPEAPTLTGSTPSLGQIRVAFTPNGDGGAAITGFTAQCISINGGAHGTQSGAASPLDVTGLTGGKNYRCRALATNAQGDGPYSDFGPVVTVPAPVTRPGRPVVKKSKALRGKRAKISFRLASDGGSPVIKFKAKCKSTNGGKTRAATRNRSPIKVKRLTPRKMYRCKVRATNAVGNSQWSKPGKKFRARR